MRLLLTGATGFVGRNFLLKALSLPEIERIAVSVRHGSKLLGQLSGEGIRGVPAKLQVLEGDSNGWNLSGLDFVPDACIHLAGVLFARHKEHYFRGNVDGVENLLRELPSPTRLIALSSQAATGPSQSAPLDETSPPRPLSFYGESKLEMEQRIEKWDGLEHPAVILRPPVVLGPRDSATVPLFRMAASRLRFKPCIQTKTLSWIAVADLVDAIFQTMDHPELLGTFFVANPSPISDLELLRAAAQAVGKARGAILRIPSPLFRILSLASRIFPQIGDAAPSLMPDRIRELLEPSWLINPGKFRTATGWEPQGHLQETMQETWDFLRDQKI